MTKTYTFENDFGADELAKALVEAGCSSGDTLEQIIAGKIEEVDENVVLDVTVDEDEVLEKLSDETIAAAYRAIGRGDLAERDVEDFLRYIRAGDLGLARAMIERVFEGAQLAAAERALS